MKQTFKFFLAALIIVTGFASSCKKEVTDSSKNNLDPAEMSKQMAVSLYKSLSGQYGGANINDGIKAPLNLTPPNKGPRINEVNPYCGLVIDTLYRLNEVVGDTIKGYFGHYKFTYSCTTNVLDSYHLDDSIANSVNYPLYTAVYKLTQKYFVKALDQTYKISSVEGSIGFSSHASLASATHGASQYHNTDIQYTLHGVRVDISSGTADVVAGTASFSAQISNLDLGTGVNNDFTGSITFLGQRIAKVAIHLNNENKIYTVNMITGEVTSG